MSRASSDTLRGLEAGAVHRSASLRAVVFGIASAMLFALSNVALRFASDAGSFDVALIRGLVFSIALSPVVFVQGIPRPESSRTRLGVGLVLFTGATLLTLITWFLGLQILPLGTATSLFALKAQFAVLGAALILGERVSARRLVAVCIGLAGGVILLNPGTPSLLGALWVTCAAASSALSGVLYARLVREWSAGSVLLISSLFQLLALAPFAAAHAAALSTFTLTMAALSALISVGVMYTLAWAYRGADVALIASLEYLRLPFAAGLGFFFFAEHISPAFFVGSAVIILGAALAEPIPRRIR